MFPEQENTRNSVCGVRKYVRETPHRSPVLPSPTPRPTRAQSFLPDQRCPGGLCFSCIPDYAPNWLPLSVPPIPAPTKLFSVCTFQRLFRYPLVKSHARVWRYGSSAVHHPRSTTLLPHRHPRHTPSFPASPDNTCCRFSVLLWVLGTAFIAVLSWKSPTHPSWPS